MTRSPSTPVSPASPDPASAGAAGTPPLETVQAAGEACRVSADSAKKRDRTAGPAIPPRAAAIRTESGAVFTGRDLPSPQEDGAVIPAERIALYRAVLAGERKLTELVIRAGATGTGDGGPPDGATLQALHEFSPGLRVFWGSSRRPRGGATVAELLPGPFTAGDLPAGRQPAPRAPARRKTGQAPPPRTDAPRREGGPRRKR